jgi:hypothetical protein
MFIFGSVTRWMRRTLRIIRIADAAPTPSGRGDRVNDGEQRLGALSPCILLELRIAFLPRHLGTTVVVEAFVCRCRSFRRHLPRLGVEFAREKAHSFARTAQYRFRS